jgi:hypothetical protein
MNNLEITSVRNLEQVLLQYTVKLLTKFEVNVKQPKSKLPRDSWKAGLFWAAIVAAALLVYSGWAGAG